MIGSSYKISLKAQCAANSMLGQLVLRRAASLLPEDLGRRRGPVARYLAAIEARVPVRHLVPGGRRAKLSRARRLLTDVEMARDEAGFDHLMHHWGQELRAC